MGLVTLICQTIVYIGKEKKMKYLYSRSGMGIDGVVFPTQNRLCKQIKYGYFELV